MFLDYVVVPFLEKFGDGDKVVSELKYDPVKVFGLGY